MDSQITHENIEKGSAFYISSEILVEMFLLGLISLEEHLLQYRRIHSFFRWNNVIKLDK